MVSAEEIVLALLRSGGVNDTLVAVIEAYGDERARAMQRAAAQVATELGAPLVGFAIERLSLTPDSEPGLVQEPVTRAS
jgi:hypothetical protein